MRIPASDNVDRQVRSTAHWHARARDRGSFLAASSKGRQGSCVRPQRGAARPRPIRVCSPSTARRRSSAASPSRRSVGGGRAQKQRRRRSGAQRPRQARGCGRSCQRARMETGSGARGWWERGAREGTWTKKAVLSVWDRCGTYEGARTNKCAESQEASAAYTRVRDKERRRDQ